MGRCKNAALAGALLGLSVAATLFLVVVMDSTRLPRRPTRPAPSAAAGLLDLPDFRYLVEGPACGGDEIAALLVVTSHACHVEARSAMRRAYPWTDLAALRVRRVFLLAVPREGGPDFVSQAALQDEARRFGDLVQGDFLEAYRNLSYKHVMGLRWAADRCSRARIVVKMDDDAVVDLPRLLQLVADRRGEVTLTGYVLAGRSPVREPYSKWFVTRREYPADEYPPFLSGWLYVTTPRVAGELVRAAHRLPYFWVDDVFVTGLAAREAGIGHQDIKDVFASHVEFLLCCLASDRYQCDYVVGPNGGQTDLIVKFQRHAARCRRLRCPQRPAHKSLRKTCVVKHSSPQLDQGHALVQQMKLR